MDKQKDFDKDINVRSKMIEEITELMGNWALRNNMCWHEGHAKALAETFIENDYGKIPENAVVLTREEYEKLKLFQERVRSGVCFTQKEWFDYCQKDSNERTSLLIKAKKDTRKETAEKLLDKIDYESNGQTKSITDLFRKKYGV